MFDCLACGRPECYHSQKYCEKCSSHTTRRVTIKAVDVISSPDFRNTLNPGEYVYRQYTNPETGDVELTIRCEVM